MRCLRIIMALSLIFVSVGLHSEGLRGHRFHYGAEWGINSPMLVGIYNTYLSTEGYLVETKDLRFSGHVNGAVLGFVGYDLSPRFGMSLLGGYMGLRAGERAYPISLRGSFALGMNGLEEGGSIFVEAGAAFRHSVKPAPVGKIGYSYRCRLARNFAVDFNAAAIASFSHPKVFDKYSGKYAPAGNVGVSQSLNVGAIITVALVF